MLDEYKGIPSQALLLDYLSFIPSVAIGFLYTEISYYLANVEHVPPFWASTTLITFGIAIVVTSIPLGILADRYGRRKMIVLGNIAAGGSLMGFALTSNGPLLVVLAAVEGIGEAAFAVSFSALIADRAGDEKRTAAFSLGFFLNWVGQAIGAFAISSVGLISRPELFILIGVLNLAVTPVIFRVNDTVVGPGRKLLPRKSGRVLFRYGIYGAAIATGAGLFVPLMTYWFSGKYGVPDTVSGPYVLGVAQIVTAGAILLGPSLAKRIGIVKAIIATQGPATMVMLAVPSSPTFVVAGTLYIVRVFLMNLSNPLGQSLLMGLVSPDERGAAAGINAVVFRLPNSLSAGPGYLLINAGLYALPFYIASVMYAIALAWFWFSFRNTRLPEEPSSAARSGPSRPSWKDSLRPAESQTP